MKHLLLAFSIFLIALNTQATPNAAAQLDVSSTKSAFRTGTVNGTQWDDAFIGIYSVAMVSGTTASVFYSTAMGNSTTASDSYFTSFGTLTVASAGGSTSGSDSTAMGYASKASGQTSTTMGNFSTAKSFAETAIGTYKARCLFFDIKI